MPAKERTEALGKESIIKLLIKLSVPASIGMAVMALYNIVDSIFIGKFVGAMGLSAVAVSFPVQMILLALAQTLGIGGGSIISRSIGAGDYQRAEHTLGNIVFFGFIIAGLLMLIGHLFPQEILRTFGASDKLLPICMEYFSVIILGAFPALFVMSLNNVVRAEGNAKIAMTAMIMSALVNVGLDYVFIVQMGIGVAGAAIATVCAQSIGGLFLLIYILSGKSALRLNIKYIIPRLDIFSHMFALGASAFSRQISTSVMLVFVNNGLQKYGGNDGDIYIGLFAVVFRVLSLGFMPMLGVLQGLLPISGYNYGAGNYRRVWESVKTALIAVSIIALVGFSFFMIFPRQLLGLFSSGNDSGVSKEEFINMGVGVVRYILIAFPLIGAQIIVAGLFQALGKSAPSFILSILRQVLFLLPMIIILPMFIGLKGIWLAFPLSDSLAFIVSMGFLVWIYRHIKESAEKKEAAETAG